MDESGTRAGERFGDVGLSSDSMILPQMGA